MDWHSVISVQQQTPDNDVVISAFQLYVLHFGHFFRKPEKLRSHTGSKWWPGDPDVKDDRLTRWPSDPVQCLVRTVRARSDPGRRSPDEDAEFSGVFVRRTEHRPEEAAVPADTAHDGRWRMARHSPPPNDGLFQGIRFYFVVILLCNLPVLHCCCSVL